MGPFWGGSNSRSKCMVFLRDGGPSKGRIVGVGNIMTPVMKNDRNMTGFEGGRVSFLPTDLGQS